MLMLAITLLFASSLAIENRPTSNNTKQGCSEDEFSCIDLTCIPKYRVCDGHKDCYLDEDEKNCAGLCDDGHFYCDDGHCIRNEWLCDGANDCMDMSDERNCPQVNQANVECPEDQFSCGGLCILSEWMCDKSMDCLNGEDEHPDLCSKEKKPVQCAENEFECEPGDCIPHRWVCDDRADCDNAADEGEHCGEHTEECRLDQGYFQCGNTTRCLEAKNVCDGVPQCKDGEDEGKFCAEKGCKTKVCSHHCIEGPSGPTCYCDKGMKLNSVGRDCEDIDECQEYGVCSQFCENGYGNYSCSCYPNYKLIDGSCYASGQDVMLYVSTEDSIRSVNVRTNRYDLVVDGLKHVVGVAYDGVDDRVYWTDVRKNTEQVESISSLGTGRQVLLNNGLDIPEDIVVDEAGRNLYFSDSHKGHIVVCKLDGTICSVLDDKNGNPRGMAIHHKEKLLFFADWGSKPAVVSIGLDGSQRKEIVTENLKWPNGVAVDQLMDRLYWSDAKLNFLESSNLDGTDRRTVLQDLNYFHPFSLAVFEDTLYWSDWSRSQLASCNKFTGKDLKVLMKEAGIKIMGITLYHPLAQFGTENPCIGHQCSHLCLPKPRSSSSYFDSHTCACPDGMELSEDRRTCELRHGDSLVLAVKGQLFSMDPHSIGKNGFSHVATIREEIRYLAEDNMNGGLIVTNSDNAIFSVNVHEKINRYISSEAYISHVAYDPIDENFFWIDSNRKAIMVQSLNTQATKIIIQNLVNPKALAFCTKDRLLIFLDERKIVTASPQGKHIKLRSHNVPTTVRHIHYVEANHTLLLGDSSAGSVHQLDLHAGALSVFLSGMQSIVSMTVFDGYFYWTQHTGNELFWVKFQRDISMSDIAWMSLSEVTDSPLDMVLLAASSNKTMTYEDVPQPCLKADCQQFCFSHSGEAKCSCEVGHNLLDDGKSCKEGCPEHLFACEDEKQRCIYHSWVCDGSPDCYNEADEKNCTVAEKCDPVNSFQCKNGECIKNLGFKCDGDEDCGDGSDEENCPPPTCKEGQFMCENKKKCILNVWKCDRVPDCTDASDEANCSAEECSEHMWTCKDGGCIPERWKCDNNEDCDDGSDEEECTPKEQTCSERSMFSCNNGLCVDLDLVCDRENDCGDGSDEQEGFCHKPEARTVTCLEGFACSNLCLPESARCNGTVECIDESDEAGCSITCDYEDSWMCQDRLRCINKAWRCDGSADCADGSDETDCPRTDTNPCEDDQYRCNTGECIDVKKACDGYNDCEDGSDESTTQCKVCDERNGGCLHVCQPTPRGPVCGCRDGYVPIKENNYVHCLDRDECELDLCPQLCTNTKGSYHCSCARGFLSEHSGHYCRATGEDMKILYVTGSHIKAVDPVTNSHYLFSNYSENIRTFAVNQGTGEIFSTLPSKSAISRNWLENILSNSPARGNHKLWKTGVERIDMIAVDWVTGNLYFSRMISPDVTVCTSNKNCTIVLQAEHPIITGIALDPSEGRMFVACFKSGFMSSSIGGIYTYGMDGRAKDDLELSDGKLIITGGISVDIYKKRVYWMDKNRGMLFSNNYQGSNLRMLTQVDSTPTFLTNFENKIFWLDSRTNQIAMYDPMSKTILDYSEDSVSKDEMAHSILVIQDQQQPKLNNPCSSAKCSHICLLSLGGSYSCRCPSGYTPSKIDSNQCIADLSFNKPSTRSPSGLPSVEESITKELVETDNSSSIIAVTVSVLLLLIFICVVVFIYFKKKGKKAPEMMMFSSNLAYSKANDSNVDNPVVQRGSIVSCDNPMFVDSHSFTPPTGLRDRLDRFRASRGQPKMHKISIGNSPSLDFSTILSVAKGASTPNQKRKEIQESDSAYNDDSASLDYEELSDQHLSVMFHKDKQRLLSDDCS